MKLFVSAAYSEILQVENGEDIKLIVVELSDVDNYGMRHEFCMMYSQTHYKLYIEPKLKVLDDGSKMFLFRNANRLFLPKVAPVIRSLPTIIKGGGPFVFDNLDIITLATRRMFRLPVGEA